MRRCAKPVVIVAMSTAVLWVTACGSGQSAAGTGPSESISAASTTTAASTASTTTATSAALTTSAAPSARAAATTSATKALISAMKMAVRGASSVRIEGSIRATNGQMMNIDGVSDRNTTAVDATVSYPNGGSYHVVLADGETYVKGNEAFWLQLGLKQIAANAKGRFVHMPPGPTPFTVGLNLPTLAADIVEDVDESEVEQVDSRSVDGVDAWVIVMTDARGMLAVDKTTSLPIRTVAGSSEPQVLTFSDWNKPVTPIVPPAGQIMS